MAIKGQRTQPRSVGRLISCSPIVRCTSWGSAIVLLACGCGTPGPPLGDVEGKVFFHGTQVREANVVFENTERGWLRTAALDSTGSYRMTGVKAAEYKVSIQPPTPQTPNENTHPDGKFIITPGLIPDPKDIPKRFRATHTSSLTAAVEPGPNKFDFDLSSAAN